jgi:hypothetical protein
MSALPPKADICGATSDVRYGPKADIGLFDHLVRLREQTLWHGYADCSSRWQVDD